MQTQLGARLAAARRHRFVGRATECELFTKALTQAPLPFQVLHLFGQGGVGKTTLLHEFAAIARQLQQDFSYLDARDLEPTPAAFERALQTALNPFTDLAPLDYLHKKSESDKNRKQIIAIDTYETIVALDGWLRNSFLPNLPESTLIVIAGRTPPALEWRSDPGWKELTHIRPLRNFSPSESESYLERRKTPSDQHQQMINFTHGHPLALSLVADAFAQRPGVDMHPADAPDVIRTLVERFVQETPTPAHRAALEACSLLRVVSEPILSTMIADEFQSDIHPLFDWLQGLSFVDLSPRGLFLHDLAREAISADLQWRNADHYQQLQDRAARYYINLFERRGSATPLELRGEGSQQRGLSDYLFLFRGSDSVRSFFEWQETGAMVADTLRVEECEKAAAIIERYEGKYAAQIFCHWLQQQPLSAIVVRDVGGSIQGVLQRVALEETDEASRSFDSAIQAAWRYLERQVRLRSGERATFFRFWLSAADYQSVSPVQSRLFLLMMQHYVGTPGLAYSFIPCANPNFWAASFVYASLQRLAQLDFTVDGREYGVYGQDWRTLSPLSWLTLLGDRHFKGVTTGTVQPEQITILSEEEFGEAVHNALRDYSVATQLRNNPLLHSRLLQQRVEATANDSERVQALRQLLQETAAFLQQSPKQVSFFRTLHHTYFQPAPTQEAAAELLDLPFSTYRRHLRSGIEFVTEQLWRLETHSES